MEAQFSPRDLFVVRLPSLQELFCEGLIGLDQTKRVFRILATPDYIEYDVRFVCDRLY